VAEIANLLGRTNQLAEIAATPRTPRFSSGGGVTPRGFALPPATTTGITRGGVFFR